jgi:GNAT superfamily N-acetyltransferase
VYAIYVVSAWWSAGAGRALMNAALAALRADGYLRAVLWVLADNVRARRFYDRAGFAPDGASTIITGLGGVLEVRYCRDLSGRLGGDDLQ